MTATQSRDLQPCHGAGRKARKEHDLHAKEMNRERREQRVDRPRVEQRRYRPD
jgi:hypothetical protein